MSGDAAGPAPSPSAFATAGSSPVPTAGSSARVSSWPPAPTGITKSTTTPLAPDHTTTESAEPTKTVNGTVTHQIGAVEPTLAALGRAASDRDEAGWAGQLSELDPGFAGTATMIYQNLDALRPTRLDLIPTGQQRAVSAARRRLLGATAFAAQVLITWQLAEDAHASEHLVWMTFAPAGDSGWRWAGTGDGPTGDNAGALPLWWLEPITVRRAAGDVVLAGSGMDASLWLSRAGIAAGHVSDRLQPSSHGVSSPDQGWDHHVVLEIPTTQRQFEQIVGASPGSDSQLAAVTYPDAMDAQDAPMRIMLNPVVMAQEPELGVDIVLTHETTHVATRSPASASPLWLIEGFADYTAYASYPAGQPSARAGLYASVRTSGAPTSPPGNDRFSPQAQQLELAYAEAWQLCVYLAAHGGPGRLNAFYASVSRSPDADVDQALHTVYGLSRAELMHRWGQALTQAAKS